ncbi:UPF0722 protein C11orf88 homolog isoform X2 [Meleagris gallopavo]|nr:UPF0722 protein C11orf88 homolog isoform X2 [Meleagris gallopavo]XP_019478430.1 UPF0722 protein C11orf88 homolog isoform X2 [Meleagris gallopavo]
MERGHQSAAPRGPTEPDGPLVFAGSSPADVEFARIFWSTAVLPPLSESSLCPTNLRREGPSSPGLSPAHRRTPSAAHGVQKAEAKEKYRQQAKKKEEILALLRKQREERIACSSQVWLDLLKESSQPLCCALNADVSPTIVSFSSESHSMEQRWKELISRPHKPKMKSNQVSRQKALEAEREDQEAVKALR